MSKGAPRHTTRIRWFFEAGNEEAIKQKAFHLEITELKPRSGEYAVQAINTVTMQVTRAVVIMNSKCMTFKENTTYPLRIDFLKPMAIPCPMSIFDRE